MGLKYSQLECLPVMEDWFLFMLTPARILPAQLKRNIGIPQWVLDCEDGRIYRNGKNDLLSQG